MFDKFKRDKRSPNMKDEDSELAINSLLGDQEGDYEDGESTEENEVVYEDDSGEGIVGSILEEEPDGEGDKVEGEPPVQEDEDEQEEESSDGKEDIKVHGIDELNAMTKENFNFFKKFKKPLMILGGILIAAIAVIAAIMLIPLSEENDDSPSPTESVNVEPQPTDNPMDFEIREEASGELSQYGEIRRIMTNKLIIRPDNALSDAIYFITDETDTSILSNLKIGDRIDFSYVIEDSRNVLKSMRFVYKGIVMTIDESLITLSDDQDKLVMLKYPASMKETFRQISVDDSIEYSLSDSETILSVSNIVRGDGVETSGRPNFAKDNDGQVILTDFDFGDWIEEYIAIDEKTPNPDYTIEVTSDFENNSVKFYNAYETPIWIRFAWRINQYSPMVPSVEQVGVSFITPNGIVISPENIEQYGRMWIDGNIINFAFEKGIPGEWTLKADKNIGFYLGETQFMLMSLTGYITVQKVGINNLGNSQLDFIWNIGGVEDENFEIKIAIKGEKYSTVLYTASSKTQDIRLVDHAIINAQAIPKGEYDVIVTVKDLDIYTSADNTEELEIPEHTRQVGAETIIHEFNAGKLTVN